MNTATFSISELPEIKAAAGASEPERFATEELRRYLGLILGQAPLRGSGDRCTLELAVDTARLDNDEAFAWEAQGNTIRITAGGPLGTVFAAYAFLRDVCACIFAAPGPDGEFVPRANPLVLRVTATRKAPVLSYRAQQFNAFGPPELYQHVIDWMPKIGFNYVHYRYTDRPTRKAGREQVDPQTGHRLYPEATGPSEIDEGYFNEHLLPHIHKRGLKLDFNHHNLWYWVPPEEHLKTHPEWFSLVDGKRGGNLNQLCICTSNQEVVAELIRRVKEFLRAHPEVRIVGVVPEDGLGMCQCDACRAQDAGPNDAFASLRNYLSPEGENRSLSRRYARLLNTVARAIRDEFPGVLVGGLAYVGVVFPPRDMAMEPNLAIQAALYWRDAARPIGDPSSPRNRFYLDLLRRWRAILPPQASLQLYEYYMGMMAQKSLPYPMQEIIPEDWRELLALGVEGASVQCFAGCYQSYAMNLTAFAHCAWGDPRKGSEIVDDYAKAMFGAAAGEVAWIFHRWVEAMAKIRGARPGELDPDPLHPQHNALLPDGGNIAYFWHALGGDDNVAQALARARRAADSPAAQRNIERFTTYCEYCRLAAAAMRQRDRARRLAASDPAAAQGLLRQVIEQHWPAVIAYAQTHRLSGWILARSISRWKGELNALREETMAATPP